MSSKPNFLLENSSKQNYQRQKILEIFFRDLSLASLLTLVLLLMAEDLSPGFVSFWFEPKIILYIFFPAFFIYLIFVIFTNNN